MFNKNYSSWAALNQSGDLSKNITQNQNSNDRSGVYLDNAEEVLNFTELYNNYRRLSKFDTGGYTGDWGAEGRLAMLHEKEIVLNKQDSSNFLDALDILRTLNLSMVD